MLLVIDWQMHFKRNKWLDLLSGHFTLFWKTDGLSHFHYFLTVPFLGCLMYRNIHKINSCGGNMTIHHTVHQTVHSLKLQTKLHNWLITTQLITSVMLLIYFVTVFNGKLWGLFFIQPQWMVMRIMVTWQKI